MNRISSSSPPLPTAPKPNAPAYCNYCGRVSDKLDFRAVSRGGAALVCEFCIRTFARMEVFTRRFGILYEANKDWSEVSSEIVAAMAGCQATCKQKSIASKIALGLLQRACRVVAGEKLPPPRIFLSGCHPTTAYRLFHASMSATGMPVAPAGMLTVGKVYRDLIELGCNGESAWARSTGIMFVSDGQPLWLPPCASICVVRSSPIAGGKTIWMDGYDKAELS